VSQFYPPVAGAVVGLQTYLIGHALAPAMSDAVLGAVSVVAFVAGFVAWIAAPVPNGSGPMMAGGDGS
jgi:hypothetical protein